MQRTTTSQGKKTIFLHTGPKSDLWDCNFMVENAIMKSRCNQYLSTWIFSSHPICFHLNTWDGHPTEAKCSAPSRPDKHPSQRMALSCAGVLNTRGALSVHQSQNCCWGWLRVQRWQVGDSCLVSFMDWFTGPHSQGPRIETNCNGQTKFWKISFPNTNKTSTSSSCYMKVQRMLLWLLYKFTNTNSSFFSQDSQVSPQNEHKHLLL